MCGSNNFHQSSTPTEPEKPEILKSRDVFLFALKTKAKTKNKQTKKKLSCEKNHLSGNSGRPLGAEVLGSKTTWK